MWSKRVVNMVRRCLSVQLNLTVWQLQECIPVGCVPPTAVAVSWGPVGVCLSACWDTPTPCLPGCGPGDPPGMGLDTPLGVGLETPQPDPSSSPLDVGLEICKACWDTHPEIPPARYAEIPLPLYRILDTRY